MADKRMFFCFVFLFSIGFVVADSEILCQSGYCRTYRFDEGCTEPPIHCSVNNATHRGLTLPSPTLCNCCDFCMPFFGEGEHCTTGGPGNGNSVGRCGDGLTCTTDEDGGSSCTRLSSACHTAQDEYDSREREGLLGALEHRPHCDGKGKFAPYQCVPAHTCFCQSEEGERIFGEVRNLGAITERTMRCGCSRFHERMKKSVASGVPYPVVGPRCTSDGNFHPIQCIGNTCYCVNILTGIIEDEERKIDLTRTPITELPCYDEDMDLFKQYSEGEPPYNFTTPCFEDLEELVDQFKQSIEEGYNIEYFSNFPECLPDGTFGRTRFTRDGKKICTDERGVQIGNYVVNATSPEAGTMDCKCAITSEVMGDVPEKPVCCKNGNFRKIQCRRGMCRCVDSDGRQTVQESADVTQLLSCYTSDWKTC